MLALRSAPASRDPAPMELDRRRLANLPSRDLQNLIRLALAALQSVRDPVRRRALVADVDHCLDELASRVIPRPYWPRDLFTDVGIVAALRARTLTGTISPALTIREIAQLGGMRRIRMAVEAGGVALELRIFANARTVILHSTAFGRSA